MDQLENVLRRLGLWECEQPAAERLASRQPFSFDMLKCHQWLQWQFIPRMRRILINGGDLPAQSAILPYAQECCDAHSSAELLFAVELVDELISGQSSEIAS